MKATIAYGHYEEVKTAYAAASAANAAAQARTAARSLILRDPTTWGFAEPLTGSAGLRPRRQKTLRQVSMPR